MLVGADVEISDVAADAGAVRNSGSSETSVPSAIAVQEHGYSPLVILKVCTAPPYFRKVFRRVP